MPRPLKVYGVMNFRQECPVSPNRGRQTRDVVAARSIAEAARLIGVSDRFMRVYGSETGNDVEVEICMADPGVVFWRPINDRTETYQRAAKA